MILCDIDGVVADASWRQHFVSGAERNWSRFFALSIDDPPIIGGIELVKLLSTSLPVIFLTGRPMSIAEETVIWLDRNVGDWWGLIMREERDYSRADVFKSGVLRQMLDAGLCVRMALDDDQRVVTAFSELGVKSVRIGPPA